MAWSVASGFCKCQVRVSRFKETGRTGSYKRQLNTHPEHIESIRKLTILGLDR